MKLPFFGKKTSPETGATGCTHPDVSQIWLREDPKDRRRTTAVKCTQCGQRLPATVPDAAK